ncbi:MAG: hypothetical protein ISR69_05510, partial [Gammaproteobacteria bacterium]|nr:hypothetical protein [Gammaproteobacteria bacterium]
MKTSVKLTSIALLLASTTAFSQWGGGGMPWGNSGNSMPWGGSGNSMPWGGSGSSMP